MTTTAPQPETADEHERGRERMRRRTEQAGGVFALLATAGAAATADDEDWGM